MMALLGGMGTFFGPFVGAGVFLLLENLVSLWTVHWQLVVGAVFVSCVLFFPRGIWGTLLHRCSRAMTDLDPGDPAVGKTFGKFTALRGVSATFPRGRLPSIIGPNGAGKSTYFNLISGAFPPQRRVDPVRGRDITGTPQHRFAAHGHHQVLPDHQRLPPADGAGERPRRAAGPGLALRHLAPPRPPAGLEDQAGALLETVGLWRRRDRHAAALAHGEQRALEIAMALAAAPRLLLLDEPTAGMSPEETRAVMDLIVRLARERTVILVEHKMKLVMGISDHLLVLHQGETLAEGTPDDIRRNETVAPRLSRPTPALMLDARAASTPGTAAATCSKASTSTCGEGEIVCLVGRNGAGKTTTLSSVMGLCPRTGGRVVSTARTCSRSPPMPATASASATSPRSGASSRASPSATTSASASSPAQPRPEREVLDEVARVFPRLAERLDQAAVTMSGGEQQMLAIARAMVSPPQAHHARRTQRRHHARPRRRDVRPVPRLRDEGTTILLVEQNVELRPRPRRPRLRHGRRPSSTPPPPPPCSRTRRSRSAT